MRPSLALLALVLLGSGPAMSSETIIRAIPDVQVVGEGRLSYAFWDVYDATLYAPSGKLHPQKPYALSLRYMREINGADIADRSIEEMRKQGFTNEARLADWHKQLKTIFPDVKDGTVLSAIFIPGKETIFYQSNKRIGIVIDAEFTSWFSNIWLGEKTSEPALRRKLLGSS